MAAANTSGGSSVMVVSFICVSTVAVGCGEGTGGEVCAGVSVKGVTVCVVVVGRAVDVESEDTNGIVADRAAGCVCCRRGGAGCGCGGDSRY